MVEEKVKNLIRALEYINENKWDAAHELVQLYEGDFAFDRIHALLHRIEGDTYNANWWYNRLGVKIPIVSFEEEIDMIKKELNL
jgi:hypothetical protein